MVTLQGGRHARHRALSISAEPAVAVDREPREPRRGRATRRRMGRTPRGCDMGVSPLYQEAAALRSRRGADLAASGQLPVPDPPARAYPTGGMW